MKVNDFILSRINFDARLKTQLQGNDIESEFLLFCRVTNRERLNLSLGLGVNLRPFGSFDIINGFVFPISLEYYPIKENEILSVIFEPAITYDGEIGIRSLYGIRFNF